jgi:hypothetical protein
MTNPAAARVLRADILAVLHQHRLLSTEQIRRLLDPSQGLRWFQRLLRELSEQDLVAHVPYIGRKRLWLLTRRGAASVAALPSRADGRPSLAPEHAAGPVLGQTYLVNEVGLSFVEAGRRYGHDCGPLAWRHQVEYQLDNEREPLVLDAELEYLLIGSGPTQLASRFIELDRTDASVVRLVAKLHRVARLYHQVREQLVWREFPGVLVLLPNGRTEDGRQRMRALLSLIRRDPDLQQVTISVGCLPLHDPFAPVFWRATGAGSGGELVNWLGHTQAPQPKLAVAAGGGEG